MGPIPAGIVSGLFPRNQMQTVAEPFVYGSGGRRMTPEDIARERKIAASMMQSDYSPVQHWSQGLGRVADNVLGAMRDRDADRAVADNQAYSRQRIAEMLSNPGGTLSASGPPGVGQSTASGGSQAALMQALADPFLDDGAKGIAQMQLEQQQKMAMKQFEYANREQPEIVQLANLANDVSQPEYVRKAAQDRITALNDPLAIIPDLGGGIGGYVGPRSQLGSTMERQMGGAPGAGTNTGDVIADPRKAASTPASIQGAPPAANVMQRDEYQMFVQSMGKDAADRFLATQGISVAGGR